MKKWVNTEEMGGLWEFPLVMSSPCGCKAPATLHIIIDLSPRLYHFSVYAFARQMRALTRMHTCARAHARTSRVIMKFHSPAVWKFFFFNLISFTTTVVSSANNWQQGWNAGTRSVPPGTEGISKHATGPLVFLNLHLLLSLSPPWTFKAPPLPRLICIFSFLSL